MKKPILFNTEMVKAILDGRKTSTRRIVKCDFKTIYSAACANGKWFETYGNHLPNSLIEWYVKEKAKPPYQVGDVLWVRETWGYYQAEYVDAPYFVYKADFPIIQDGIAWDEPRWHPSIHMPKEAARIFLKVTGVKVQRLQDISEDEARKEGCLNIVGGVENCRGSAKHQFIRIWNSLYNKPQPVKEHGRVTHYESYPWDDIQGTRTYKGLPWIVCGNAWIWAIEFNRIKSR